LQKASRVIFQKVTKIFKITIKSQRNNGTGLISQRLGKPVIHNTLSLQQFYKNDYFACL